jgi:type II secretory pathway component GspD/PulD (secretin)
VSRPRRQILFMLLATMALARAGVGEEALDPSKPAGNTNKPQVLIEGRVLEWQVSDEFNFAFGIDYMREAGGGGIVQGGDLTLPANPSLSSAARIFFEDVDISNGSFDAFIETLEQVGQVKVLFKPSIVLTARHINREGIEEDPINDPELDLDKYDPESHIESKKYPNYYDARLSNSTRIPYEFAEAIGVRLVSVTQYLDTGVTMDVSVLDVDDDLVTVDLRTTVQDLSGFVNVGLNERNEATRVPMREARKIQNRVIIPDRMIFLAGLIKSTTRQYQRQGIPWLGEIPILNLIFSNRRNQYQDIELVFLIKPEVITPYRPIDVSEGQ